MIKRIALLCFFIWICIVSCKNSNAPDAVAEKFLISFSQFDYESAKSLSTKNTWEMLDIMAAFTKDMPEAGKDAIANHLKIKITDTKQESDSTLIVTYTSDPKILPFNKLRMLKTVDENGRDRWKVDISTLDLVGGEELYIEEENKADYNDEATGADTTAGQEDPDTSHK
jgi:hypothetical protein